MTTENQAIVETSASDQPSFPDYLPTPSSPQPINKKYWISLFLVVLLGVIAISGSIHYMTKETKVYATWEEGECDPKTGMQDTAKVPFFYNGDIAAYKAAGGRVTQIFCDGVSN